MAMSSWWQDHSRGSGGWAGHDWDSGWQGGYQNWGNGHWDNNGGDYGDTGSQKRSAPNSAPNDSRDDGRALKRRTTEEGRSYDAYTYLGGDSKASLPLPDRCKLVQAMLDGAVGALTLNTMSGAQPPSTPP